MTTTTRTGPLELRDGGLRIFESMKPTSIPARSPRPADRNLLPPPSVGADHTLLTLPAPLAQHRWQAEQRVRERRELAAWLGTAAD
jgi:hypothetical protein